MSCNFMYQMIKYSEINKHQGRMNQICIIQTSVVIRAINPSCNLKPDSTSGDDSFNIL